MNSVEGKGGEKERPQWGFMADSNWNSGWNLWGKFCRRRALANQEMGGGAHKGQGSC